MLVSSITSFSKSSYNTDYQESLLVNNTEESDDKNQKREIEKEKFYFLWKLSDNKFKDKLLDIILAINGALLFYNSGNSIRGFFEKNNSLKKIQGSYKRFIKKQIDKHGTLEVLNRKLSSDPKKDGLDNLGEFCHSFLGFHLLEDTMLILFGILSGKGFAGLINHLSGDSLNNLKEDVIKASSFSKLLNGFLSLVEKVLIAKTFMGIAQYRMRASKIQVSLALTAGLLLGEFFTEMQDWFAHKAMKIFKNKIASQENKQKSGKQEISWKDSFIESLATVFGFFFPLRIWKMLQHTFEIYSLNKSSRESSEGLNNLKSYNYWTIISHKNRHIGRLRALWDYKFKQEELPKFDAAFHTLKNWKIYGDWLESQTREQAVKTKTFGGKLLNYWEYNLPSVLYKKLRFPNWTAIIESNSQLKTKTLMPALYKDWGTHVWFTAIEMLALTLPLNTVFNYIANNATYYIKNLKSFSLSTPEIQVKLPQISDENIKNQGY